MDESIKHINLSGKDLSGLPLFFWKIHYNLLTGIEEEEKLMRYNPNWQCSIMRDAYPVRQISKTVIYKVLKPVTNGQ